MWISCSNFLSIFLLNLRFPLKCNWSIYISLSSTLSDVWGKYFLHLTWNLKDVCMWTVWLMVILGHPDPTVGIRGACVGACPTPPSPEPNPAGTSAPFTELPAFSSRPASDLGLLTSDQDPRVCWSTLCSPPASHTWLLPASQPQASFSFRFSSPCHFVSPYFPVYFAFTQPSVWSLMEAILIPSGPHWLTFPS